MTHPALVRAATETIAKGSKSFAVAARLFGRETREGAVMLYAWCRYCDDTIDEQDLGRARAKGDLDERSPWVRLESLEQQTRSALAGEPQSDIAFAALQAAAQRHAIPERLPMQHLAGFRMDLQGRRYETIEDTLDYSYHVAGVVGVMMAHIMGVRDPAVLDRASDLGIAFQLTNIARDIVEDAAIGRIYLPRSWLAEAGLPPEEVGAPAHRAALARVAGRLIEAAEPYYASASIGIAALPPRSAWAIATAHGVYRQIGIEVRRRGARAWDERVSTTKLQKLGHVVRGAVTAALTRSARPSREVRRGLYERPA
jgi:phytoene synthase